MTINFVRILFLIFSYFSISVLHADESHYPGLGEGGGANKPMKFFLAIGMDAADGDMVNPICVSNVITTAGPKNWNNGDVHRVIEAHYKSAFIEKCRAHRTIRDGQDTPQYSSNQYGSDMELEDAWVSNKERRGVFLVTLP